MQWGEWQRWLKEWSSLNKGGTITSRGWIRLFLVSKTLGVALLPPQKFPSKFIRGISPRLPLTAASRGVGEEVEEKAQLSSDLGRGRNGSGLLWRSCEVMRRGIMRLESQSWRSRGPAVWPWPWHLTFLLRPSRLCPVCESPGCPLHSTAAAQGCWGALVDPVAPCSTLQKHEARDVQKGFQWCLAPASRGMPSSHQRGSGLGNPTAQLSLISPAKNTARCSRPPEEERCIPAATRAACRAGRAGVITGER